MMSSLKKFLLHGVYRNRNAANLIIGSTSAKRYTNTSDGAALASGVKCWNCGSDINKAIFKCCSCGKLQDCRHPKDVDFFKLLEVEARFEVNSAELSKKFRALQTKVHPDKFAGKDDDREKQNSIDWSTLLNKAYKTLSAPLPRGEYMLRNQLTDKDEEGKTVRSQVFLTEMMEKNEEVDEADTKSELEKLLEVTDVDINKMLEELRTAFDNKDFRNAKDILEKMKFLYSLKNGIKLKLESMLSE